jgi:HSP20 family protein
VTDTPVPQDAVDLAEDARRLLLELDRDVAGASTAPGECRPPLDVVETSDAVEIVVDVPGTTPEGLRIVVRRNTVLIVGAKLSKSVDSDARFHVAERGFGRFARAVRVTGTFDARQARATLAAGLLRIVLPRIEDRRGAAIEIPITRA